MLSIIAFIGLPNLHGLLEYQSDLYPIVIAANPLLVAFVFFFVLWSIVAELWLSEFPNQIIALACVQARPPTDSAYPVRAAPCKNAQDRQILREPPES